MPRLRASMSFEPHQGSETGLEREVLDSERFMGALSLQQT